MTMNSLEILGLITTLSAGTSAVVLARGRARVMEIRAKHRAKVLDKVLECSVRNLDIFSHHGEYVMPQPEATIASMQWTAEQMLDSPVDPNVNFAEVASRRFQGWRARLLYRRQPREEILLQRAERRRALREGREQVDASAAPLCRECQQSCSHEGSQS